MNEAKEQVETDMILTYLKGVIQETQKNFYSKEKNTYEEIADCTGLTVEEVEKLAETLDHTA